MTGYAAIAHFRKQPVFGVLYYVMFLDGFLIYTLLYEKGFMVPRLFEQAKTMLMLSGTQAEREMLRRQVKSIPPLGIMVGQFHMLERTSTPVFMHYVLSNIVSMLVVFK